MLVFVFYLLTNGDFSPYFPYFRILLSCLHNGGILSMLKPVVEIRRAPGHLPSKFGKGPQNVKVGVNPNIKKEMWLLMHLITKKTCTKMYKSIHFWNQKNQMNPMVATDFCKIMRFIRNSSVTMVTIEFFLDSIRHGFGFDLGFTAKNGKIQSCPKHNIEYVFWARILCRIHFWSQKCKICYSFLNININVESCASDGSQNMRPTSSDSI